MFWVLNFQISRPEDWEKVPDPKKYFVQFSGTEEIREHHPLVEKAAHQQVSNEESGVNFLAIQSQELDISSSPTSCAYIQILSLPKHRDSSSKKPKKKLEFPRHKLAYSYFGAAILYPPKIVHRCRNLYV